MRLPFDSYHVTEKSEIVVQRLVEQISELLLQNQAVLWLVSGGSNIQAAVTIQHQLSKLASLELLTVGLIDERYGVYRHEDSNWQQLLDAGWDDQLGTMLEVLQSTAFDRNQTVENYEDALQKMIEKADKVVGLFGIGADGHTAGILPDSDAINAAHDVIGYTGPDYERISITSAFIPKIDFAVVSAFGETKNKALITSYQDGPVDTIPARLLATAKSLVVYTDNKGVI